VDKLLRETVQVTVESVKGYALRIATLACKIACSVTKADIARRLGLALLQLEMVQSFAVEGLLKGLLKSPPCTRAPSFAA
jgi:hypothetical protein